LRRPFDGANSVTNEADQTVLKARFAAQSASESLNIAFYTASLSTVTSLYHLRDAIKQLDALAGHMEALRALANPVEAVAA
jgi:phage shock protein A